MRQLELRPLGAEHTAGVRSLLLKSFFIDEPLNHRFGFDLPNEVEDFIDAVTKAALNDQCSFVFVENDRLAAMILNVIKKKDEPESKDELRSTTLRYIYKMLGALQKDQTVFDYLKTDHLLYTAIVSVDSDYRGQRLSEKLIQKSLDYAKEQLNLQGAYTETTSHFSLKAYLKMGFEVINEMLYETYDKEKLSNMGVHDRCSLVVRKL